MMVASYTQALDEPEYADTLWETFSSTYVQSSSNPFGSVESMTSYNSWVFYESQQRNLMCLCESIVSLKLILSTRMTCTHKWDCLEEHIYGWLKQIQNIETMMIHKEEDTASTYV